MEKPNQKRLDWLKRFLGDKGAMQAEDALAKLSSTLDNAGVQSKETRLKGVMENMQADFAKALAKYVDNPSPELINELIATAMSAMLPTSEEVLDEEVMMDDEIADDEALMNETMMKKPYDEMGKAIRNVNADLANVAKDVREQNEMLGELIPSFAQLAEALVSIRSDVQALKAKVNAQPKRAGMNENGVVDNPTVANQMKNASDGVTTQIDPMWGLPASALNFNSKK